MEEGTSTAAAGKLVAKALRKRGVKGILPLMADRDQLVELLCEVPECYCPNGPGVFREEVEPMKDWAPNVDHSPIPKWKGGKLEADNVRLAHVRCNKHRLWVAEEDTSDVGGREVPSGDRGRLERKGGAAAARMGEMDGRQRLEGLRLLIRWHSSATFV